MSMTKVALDPQCITDYEAVRTKKLRYAIFRFNPGGKGVEVEKTGQPHQTYSDFLADIPKNEARYGLFNFEYETEESFEVDGVQKRAQRNKLCYILWVPDSAAMRQKMMVTASSDQLKREFRQIDVILQATDAAEVSEESLLAKSLLFPA